MKRSPAPGPAARARATDRSSRPARGAPVRHGLPPLALVARRARSSARGASLDAAGPPRAPANPAPRADAPAARLDRVERALWGRPTDERRQLRAILPRLLAVAGEGEPAREALLQASLQLYVPCRPRPDDRDGVGLGDLDALRALVDALARRFDARGRLSHHSTTAPFRDLLAELPTSEHAALRARLVDLSEALLRELIMAPRPG